MHSQSLWRDVAIVSVSCEVDAPVVVSESTSGCCCLQWGEGGGVSAPFFLLGRGKPCVFELWGNVLALFGKSEVIVLEGLAFLC